MSESNFKTSEMLCYKITESNGAQNHEIIQQSKKINISILIRFTKVNSINNLLIVWHFKNAIWCGCIMSIHCPFSVDITVHFSCVNRGDFIFCSYLENGWLWRWQSSVQKKLQQKRDEWIKITENRSLNWWVSFSHGLFRVVCECWFGENRLCRLYKMYHRSFSTLLEKLQRWKNINSKANKRREKNTRCILHVRFPSLSIIFFHLGLVTFVALFSTRWPKL